MSTYNDSFYLRESIESILNQTWNDFEFLIINDGSTDRTLEILNTIQDPRVKVINNLSNIGLANSLKIGLEQATGKYIARMDSDDISLPQRLEQQVKFLENNVEVGILGTYYIIYNDFIDFIQIPSLPIQDVEIKWLSLFGCPFAHPTVMLRKEIFARHKLNYNSEFNYAEDYDLWTRSLEYTKGANLSEPLLKYRIRSGISQTRKREQHELHRKISFRTVTSSFPDLNFTFEEVCQIGALYFNPDIFAPMIPTVTTDEERFSILENYFRLFVAFLVKQPDSHHKRTLTKRIAMEIAREFKRLPKNRSWRSLGLEMLDRFPSLPLWLGSSKISRFLQGGV